MDDAFFISRDARLVANELQQGDATGAANRLREDCAHMLPGEFSSLLQQTRGDQGPGALAGISLYGDGHVAVRSQDGSQIPAGQLPPLEIARLEGAPPPHQYYPPQYPQYGPGPVPPECYPQPGPVYVEPHRMWAPPERVYVQPVPLNNTAADTVGGAIIGGIIGSSGHGRNGGAAGAAIGAAAGLIIGTAQDNANR